MSAKSVTAPPAREEPGSAGATSPRRRRVPAWAAGLVGAALTAVYGAAVEKLSFGPPLVMLMLGGMTLALCGMALWRVIDPLTHADGAADRDPRAPGRARELEREKQAVLKAIKEIELDHQMRKIADVDYKELIDRYRGRAMRLISDIEAGDNFRELIERELKDRLSALPANVSALPANVSALPANVSALPAAAAPAAITATPAAATAGAARGECSTCGTVNDPDAQFCKKCGVKLAA